MLKRPAIQQEEGGLIPTSPLHLTFRVIQKSHANRLFVENHYAHRAVPISECYGIFIEKDNGIATECVGAISFGKPASPSLCTGICGKEYSHNVFELNRLWVSDRCPKFTESKFIGWALRMLKIKHPDWIIVSYADSAQNHSGTIYRATNFIYTGKTKPHIEWDNGTGKHSRHIKCDSSLPSKQRSIKWRYVYFLNPKFKQYLKYPILRFEK